MTRLRVEAPGRTGRNARVFLDDKDVSAFLQSVTIDLDVNAPHRATLEAVAFSLENFEAEAEARCIVKFGPYTGRGKDMAEALHQMVERFDRAQDA